MKKLIRLTESELKGIIKKIINEAPDTYRTSNLSNPAEFLPNANPSAPPSFVQNTPRPDINYPDIPQPKKAPVAPKTIFGIGDKGAEVLAFQKHLVKLGYNVGKKGVDGIFGPATEASVKQFQAKHGIKVSGRVGPPTKRKLVAAAASSTVDQSNRDPNAEWNIDRAYGRPEEPTPEWARDRAYDNLPQSPASNTPTKDKVKTPPFKFSSGAYGSLGWEGKKK